MYFVTLKPSTDNSFKSVASRIFQPFTATLWSTIVIVSTLVGVVYVFLDDRAELWSAVKGDSTFWEDRTRLEGSLVIVRRVCDFWYVAFLELLSGSPREDDERTLPQRVVTLAWGLFIVIILAAYTAVKFP